MSYKYYQYLITVCCVVLTSHLIELLAYHCILVSLLDVHPYPLLRHFDGGLAVGRAALTLHVLNTITVYFYTTAVFKATVPVLPNKVSI